MSSGPRWLGLYARALRLLPRAFRRAHGHEMVEAVRRRDVARPRGALGAARLALSLWTDLLAQIVLLRVELLLAGGRGGAPGGDLGRHLTVTARSLWRARAFTLAALLTLGLGIGVNAGAYAVLRSVALRPLPYPDPGQLVSVTQMFGTRFSEALAPSEIVEVRDRMTRFRSVAWSFAPEQMAIVGDGRPVQVQGARVSTTFFETLGVEADFGRTFVEGDVSGADSVVVLSASLWDEYFGGDVGAVGATILVDGVQRSVVGVLPSDFTYDPLGDVRIWVPRVFDPESPNFTGWSSDAVVARVADGATVAEAAQELAVLGSALADEYPDRRVDTRLDLRPLRAAIVGDFRDLLLIMQGIAAAVLLVACGNLVNLLIARANRGRIDVAVRKALGASPGTILAERAVEGILLAVPGAVLGVALSAGALTLALRLAPELLPRTAEVGLDPTVVALTGFGSLLVVWIAEAVSFLSVRSSSVYADVRTGSGRMGPLRAGLLAVQVGSVMGLLVVAGALGATFLELLRVDPGFETDGRWTVRVTLPAARYPTAPEIQSLFDRVRASISAIPGVAAVAGTATLPLSGEGITIPAPHEAGRMPTGPATTRVRTGWNGVTRGYFDAIGIPLVAGRDFDDRDADGEPVLIVNRSLALEIFGTDHAVDRSVQSGSRIWRVVGVVGDVRHDGLHEVARREMYQPGSQVTFAWPTMEIVVRTAGPVPGFSRALREAVWAVDPQQPVPEPTPLEDVISSSLDDRRAMLAFVALLAATALSLGLVGIYGVVAYLTSMREREIGIRVALGARAATIRRLVVASVVPPLGVGTVVGAALGWLAIDLLDATVGSGSFVGWPVTVLVGVALLLSGLAAAWPPALRASRYDPVRAMRS